MKKLNRFIACLLLPIGVSLGAWHDVPAEVKIAHALLADGLSLVNMHAYSFGAGTHTLRLGKGAVLLLGFVPDGEPLPVFDAGLGSAEKEVDCLFE